MEGAKKTTNSLHKKILIVVLACLALAAIGIVAISIFGRQKPSGDVALGEGFFTDVNETETAEVGIEYLIAKGKALNGKEVITPTVTLTLNGESVAMENYAFVPTAIDDYIIDYEYQLPTGKVVELETVLTVKDTNKPSILGADEIDTKVKVGDLLDFSKLAVIDRSGEEIKATVQVYEGKGENQAIPLTLSDNKLKIKSSNGYSVSMAAKDSSGNEEKIVRNIDIAAKDEFEFANNEEYVKKYVYGEHSGNVSWNSDPQFVFEGEGSIKFEYTKDVWWPCIRFAKPMITDITKAYALSFWVYNDSDTEIPLYVCQKFAAKQRLIPHAWTKVTITTEEMLQNLGTKKEDYAIAADMTMFQLMHNNSDFYVDGTLYFDTFMVEWEEPAFKIECGEQMVFKPGTNIILDTPTVTGMKLTDLTATLRDTSGKEATTVTYKNGQFIAAKLTDGEYYVTYTYRNGMYGCMGSQKIVVSEADYDVLYRYSSQNGVISAERKIVHGKDGSAAAKYENGLWSRWSFINIQDEDILPLTKEDSIEFWVRFEKTDSCELEQLTLRTLTKSTEEIQLSPEITLEEGVWTKVFLNAAYMEEYLKAKDGLRIRLTGIGGTNDFTYNLYLDDFKVVKGGNKADIEATRRYSSENGELSAAKDKSHGKDGSIGVKYSNGQWSRWSFISIDDRDILPVTEKDRIEFWVMYEKNPNSEFDGLSLLMLTENSLDVRLSNEITLKEGAWTKVALNASQMKKYIEAKDGLRIQSTVVGGTGDYMWYDLYIDDFKVVKGGNKIEVEATSRYSSENGELSAAKDKSHGTDGSIGAKYSNGQWSRWSFISIDDRDILPVTEKDRIEFWVMYEKNPNSEFDGLSLLMLTENSLDVRLSNEIPLKEGVWTKVALNASQMKKYIEAKDGLRIQSTVVGGSGHYMWYDLYIDDFKVVKGGNKIEVEATSRYSSENGELSAAKDKSHGTDGSIGAKYSNGQWSRWSFISIDDSDILPVTEKDRIEFWVMYEKNPNSEFDGLNLLMYTEGSFDTQLLDNISLEEGVWTKVALNASQMKKYIEAKDGLRIQSTVVGGTGDYMWYDLYIDDFKVVKGGNKAEVEATSRYSSENGEFSSAKDKSHGTDGSIGAKYSNGQWSRWSFISIDDSDILPVTEKDRIEFWVMYEKNPNSEFDGLSLHMLTESSLDVRLTDDIPLEEGVWTKISLNASQMKKYIEADDGLRIQSTVVGGSGHYMWYDLYIDDFQVVRGVNEPEQPEEPNEPGQPNEPDTPGETETVGDYFSTDDTKGTLETVSGPLYGRDEDSFVKYINHSNYRWSYIAIDDTNFVDALTEDDSIRFYVYIEKNEGFDGESVILGLLDSTHTKRAQNNLTIPFGEWTMVTIPKWGMKEYLDAASGLHIVTGVAPESGIGAGSNMGFTMYLSDIEILKLANTDLTPDMITSLKSSSSVTTTGIKHDETYLSGAHVLYQNGTWEAYARVKIDDTAIKREIEPGDSLEFWVYIEPSNGSVNGTGKLWLSSLSDETAFGEQIDVQQMGGGWVKVTLDANGVQNYLNANNGLQICINMLGCDFPAYNCYIGDLAVVKDEVVRKCRYTPTNEVNTVEWVSGPLYNREGNFFTKYTNASSQAVPFINVDTTGLALTESDTLAIDVYIPRASATDTTQLKYNWVYNDTNYINMNSSTLSFDTWMTFVLTGDDMKTYLANKDKGLTLLIWVVETSDMKFEMYLGDVTVRKCPYTPNSAESKVTMVSGPIYNKEGDLFAKYTNSAHQAVPYLEMDDAKWNLTESDTLTIDVYIPTPSNTNITDIKYQWLNGDSTEYVSNSAVTIPFNTWTTVTLTGADMKKYLDLDNGLRLLMWSVYDGDLTFEMYMTDVKITRAAN